MRVSSLGIGVLLITVAVIVLLGQTGALDASDVLGDWWPVAIIWLAVVQWLSHPRHVFGPLLVGIVGLALLAATSDAVDAQPVAIAFAALLLVAGVLVIKAAFVGERSKSDGASASDSFVIFGGRELMCRDNPFSSASIASVFGGTELDLTEAVLAPDGATVDVLSVFGGAEITVPREWKVDVRVTSILGGVADSTRFEPAPDGWERAIVVDGLVLFGGVEITNPEPSEETIPAATAS